MIVPNIHRFDWHFFKIDRVRFQWWRWLTTITYVYAYSIPILFIQSGSPCLRFSPIRIECEWMNSHKQCILIQLFNNKIVFVKFITFKLIAAKFFHQMKCMSCYSTKFKIIWSINCVEIIYSVKHKKEIRTLLFNISNRTNSNLVSELIVNNFKRLISSM